MPVYSSVATYSFPWVYCSKNQWWWELVRLGTSWSKAGGVLYKFMWHCQPVVENRAWSLPISSYGVPGCQCVHPGLHNTFQVCCSGSQWLICIRLMACRCTAGWLNTGTLSINQECLSWCLVLVQLQEPGLVRDTGSLHICSCRELRRLPVWVWAPTWCVYIMLREDVRCISVNINIFEVSGEICAACWWLPQWQKLLNLSLEPSLCELQLLPLCLLIIASAFLPFS